jgi:hypothetical protein
LKTNLSGRLGVERNRTDRRQTLRRDRVIAAMSVTAARLAFFLNVRDFPTRRHFAVSTDDASARKSGEAKKPNETHRVPSIDVPRFSNMYAANSRAIVARVSLRFSTRAPDSATVATRIANENPTSKWINVHIFGETRRDKKTGGRVSRPPVSLQSTRVWILELDSRNRT